MSEHKHKKDCCEKLEKYRKALKIILRGDNLMIDPYQFDDIDEFVEAIVDEYDGGDDK